MGDYATLKAGITANIKQNDSQLITGAVLQGQLLAMVNELGAGYQFMGIATPETNPGTPDEKVFYIAEPGTYANFGGTVVSPGNIGIFLYDTSWTYQSLGLVEIVNNLTDGGTGKALSAEQGKNLANNIIQLTENTLGYTPVPPSQLTDIGASVMDARTGKILTSPTTTLSYFAVEAGKTYLVSSTIQWLEAYAAVGFSESIPQINGDFTQILNAGHIGQAVFVAPADGYIILCFYFSTNGSISIVNENRIDDLEEELKSSLTVFRDIPTSDLTLLGGGFIPISTRDINPTEYSTIYYYPVVGGRTYKLSSGVHWYDIYASLAFMRDLPTIGGRVDEIIASAGEPHEDIFYTAPFDGYILLLFHFTEVSKISVPEDISIQDIYDQVGDLFGKTIAVIGDSIMQNMGGPLPSNTITLKNYDDPTDTTVYQTSDATIVGGILYLTSSLSGGEVTEDSVRLEVVNSAQQTIDSWSWDYLKDKLHAKRVINCAQGGARFPEMGCVTEYPSVTPSDALLSEAIRSFPNQVRMLKRLVADGVYDAPDVVVIWMGVNGTTGAMTDTLAEAMSYDWNTLSDDALGYTYRTKFYGAIRYGIESLYRAFPDTVIVFVSPVMTSRGNLKISQDTAAYRGYDNLAATAEGIKSIAERYACLFFDALHQIGVANFAYRADSTQGSNEVATGIPLGNLIPRFTRDGLHPNELGMKVWGNYLARMLKSNYFSKK